MNVVIWARVSSNEQKEGYSVDAQLRACRDRVEKCGWKIVREFAVAESARRGAERVAFNEMFAWVRKEAKKLGINAILAHKLDRICRNMRDAVRMQELEDACGVQLAFVENQFAPGAAGALSFNVMAAVAQYYSDNLRSEVLKGMDERIRQGWPLGKAPFGYMNTGENDEPVRPEPEKAKALERVFELFSTGRYTFEQLGNQLATEGFVYRNSERRFDRSILSGILNNRFYVGELHRHGKVYPGKYKLLITREKFEACQDLLKGRNRRMTKQAHPFAGGLFRCFYCGFAMTGEKIKRKLRSGNVREHVYYRCGNNNPPADHPQLRWREGDLEATILEDFAKLKLAPELAEWFRRGIENAFDEEGVMAKEHRQALRKRKTELANMQDRLLNTYLLQTIDEKAFQAKMADLKRQAAEVETALGKGQALIPETREQALSVFNFSQNLAELWEGSNWNGRKEILEGVSLNRTISTEGLCLQKTKALAALAERSEKEETTPTRI